MIPRINQGHSFKGVTAYLMHDKKADTAERVLWTDTGNMHTNDIHKAAKVMAWTDLHADDLKRESGGSLAGRKVETGAVYHYSLSWAQGEVPDQDHQQQSVLSTLKHLGLIDHQYYIVAHDDTKHAHIHVVANLTHPETGKRAELGLDKRRIQEWALGYEREHGLHCKMREFNAAAREQENARTYYPEKKKNYGDMITRAYEMSDNGQSFKAALEMEGLQLARGRKWVLVIDDQGEMQTLARMVDGHKTRDMQAKLADLDRDLLPGADTLSQQIKQQTHEQERIPAHEQTTGEIADDYIKLAQDPLSDVQRWNDTAFQNEQQQDRSDRLLPDQSSERTSKYSELRQVRGEEYYFDRDRYEQQQQYAIDQAGIDLAIEKENASRIAQEKAKEEKTQRAKKNKAVKYQQLIDRKIAVSKKTWQIDELIKERDQARDEVAAKSGMLSRLLQRAQIALTKDHLQDMEKRLEERRGRWLADIDAANANRPTWAREQERQRYGFLKVVGQKNDTDQSRQYIEVETTRIAKDSVMLQEVDFSTEATERHSSGGVTIQNIDARYNTIMGETSKSYLDLMQREEAQKKQYSPIVGRELDRTEAGNDNARGIQGDIIDHEI